MKEYTLPFSLVMKLQFYVKEAETVSDPAFLKLSFISLASQKESINYKTDS